MGDTQYAIQYTGVDEFIVNDSKPIDPVGPTQILLQVQACGICFSDTKLLHQFAGHPRKSEVVGGIGADELATIPSYHPGTEPVTPGHEPVAKVVAVGDQVSHFRVGDRVLIQADWKHIPTAASNGAFGYNFDGALQEYVVVDERIIVHGEEEFLIRVSDEPTAAAVALVEPWATVEAAYTWPERNHLKAGGRLLVVSDADADGVEELVAAHQPGEMITIGSGEAGTVSGPFDDIIYFGADADVIETLGALLGTRSLFNIVLGGQRIERGVQIDVGRIHYDFMRYIGSTGSSAAESYRWIPADGQLRPRDRMAIIGAAGPMGLMHTMRAAVSGVPGLRIEAADVNDDRLANLAAVVAPAAERNGVPLEVVNSATTPLEAAAYSYVVCLVPVPALMAQSVDIAGEGAIVNAFAGFPAGTQAVLDLQGMIERQVFLIGTSGSEMADMRTVLSKVESGVLDTTISLDAITGMAGFSDAIASVINRTSGGKILVYPQLHDQGLVRLVDMPEKLPHVAALLEDGLWTPAAERALLGGK